LENPVTKASLLMPRNWSSDLSPQKNMVSSAALPSTAQDSINDNNKHIKKVARRKQRKISLLQSNLETVDEIQKSKAGI
jgi:hypothetical protein